MGFEQKDVATNGRPTILSVNDFAISCCVALTTVI
jgi:hypothetical protein